MKIEELKKKKKTTYEKSRKLERKEKLMLEYPYLKKKHKGEMIFFFVVVYI